MKSNIAIGITIALLVAVMVCQELAIKKLIDSNDYLHFADKDNIANISKVYARLAVLEDRGHIHIPEKVEPTKEVEYWCPVCEVEAMSKGTECPVCVMGKEQN